MFSGSRVFGVRSYRLLSSPLLTETTGESVSISRSPSISRHLSPDLSVSLSDLSLSSTLFSLSVSSLTLPISSLSQSHSLRVISQSPGLSVFRRHEAQGRKKKKKEVKRSKKEEEWCSSIL
jgi:hypothetical protein